MTHLMAFPHFIMHIPLFLHKGAKKYVYLPDFNGSTSNILLP
jgi:hypothetical protein